MPGLCPGEGLVPSNAPRAICAIGKSGRSRSSSPPEWFLDLVQRLFEGEPDIVDEIIAELHLAAQIAAKTATGDPCSDGAVHLALLFPA